MHAYNNYIEIYMLISFLMKFMLNTYIYIEMYA